MDETNGHITSERLTVTSLFSESRFYYIPEYQRPFSWKQSNFEDLLDDLLSAPRNKEYFLGTLVLHEVEDRTINIVDGQQRITSLIILLACVRDAFGRTSDSTTPHDIQNTLLSKAVPSKKIPQKYLLTTRDTDIFSKSFYEIGSTSSGVASPQKRTDVQDRYEVARKIFTSKLQSLGVEELEELALFIFTQCFVVALSSRQFSDSFRLFEVVNDRGQQLRRVDILKSYNISSDAIAESGMRQRAAQEWEDCEERLGSDRFQQVFSLLRFIHTRSKPELDLNSEFQNKIIGKKDMPNRGTEFVGHLRKAVDIYEELFVTYDYQISGKDAAAFKSLIFIMDQYIPTFEWRAVILASAMKFGESRILDLLERVEKVSIQHWVSGVRKDERFSEYAKMLKSIAAAKGGDQSWIDEISYDESVIRQACLQSNFYGISAAKYLLCKVELASVEMDHEHKITARSVEHVLPQNPKRRSKWMETFSLAERKTLTNCSGNLVLLTKGKNSSAGNKDFIEKKESYFVGKIPPYPQSSKVLTYESWTPEVVKERRDAFADLVLAPLT